MAEDNEIPFDTDGVSVIQDNDPALTSESDVVSFVQGRFKRAEDVRQPTETTEDYTVLTFSLQKQKSLEYL